MQYVLFLKFAYTKSLECNWWLNHQPKVHVKTTQLILDFLWKIPCNVKAELSVVLWQQCNTEVIFFENWQVWNMVSPAKYFQKHTFSDVFPAFCTHFTASVAPLLIFSNNNNERKGKSSSKILYEETEVFLKTSPNIKTLSIFFSSYSWSFSTKLKLFSL